MKKTLVISWILILSLLLFAPCTAASEPVADDVTAQKGCASLQAQVPIGGNQQKLETAKAAILYELNTDTLVYSYQPDMPINPTGLVKLLTAWIAIEFGHMDDMVTVRRSVLDTVAIGAVSAGLKAGEEISVRDLLYCIMVSSANDAAAVLADYISGSQAEFVQKLNDKAAQLGCTGSRFTNVHGLMDPQQTSTARDLAVITAAALENEQFCEMFGTKTYTVPATNKSEPRVLKTTNHMMSDAILKTHVDPRVTGGKPAAATNTDRSMICTAEVGTSRYLCVVMSAAAEVSEDGLSVTRWNIFEEVSFLLDYGFANFAVRQIADHTQAMYQFVVSDGDCDVVLRPSESISVVLPLNFSVSDLSYSDIVDAELLKSPISVGDSLGTLYIQYGSVYVGSCSLVAMSDVRPAGSVILPAERLELPSLVEETIDWSRIFIWFGIVVFALLVCAICVLIGIQVMRNAKLRSIHRRRARDRRRNRR